MQTLDSTVVKGFAVLELLARSQEPMRLSAIADALAIRRSNAHRLLATLNGLGFVERQPGTTRYMPTLKAWELGAAVHARHPVQRAVAPHIQDLHRRTSETVTLSILDGVEILMLDKIQSRRAHRFLSREGSRLPAIANPGGRVMMAYEPDPDRLVRLLQVEQPTLDVEGFLEDLKLIRTQGYAIGVSRRTPGVMGVAAAIPTRDGRSTASLMVTGPVDRLNARLPAIIEETCAICAHIANEAGRI